MKRPSISTYIIALLTLSSWLFLPAHLHAQDKLFQGVKVGVDVLGLLNQALGSDAHSSEASVEVNLKNRFFPIMELGYGGMETTDDETDIYFKTSAPFVRLGMDYNVLYKKPHLPGYFTVGVRYGFSSFKYDVQAPDLVDPNWGNIAVPVRYEGVKSNVSWAELVVGLKTNVYKNFYIGFTARYRARLSMTKNENSEPSYIPGYGQGKSSNYGITYNLVYKLPF